MKIRRPKSPELLRCPKCRRPTAKQKPGTAYQCFHCGTQFDDATAYQMKRVDCVDPQTRPGGWIDEA